MNGRYCLDSGGRFTLVADDPMGAGSLVIENAQEGCGASELPNFLCHAHRSSGVFANERAKDESESQN